MRVLGGSGGLRKVRPAPKHDEVVRPTLIESCSCWRGKAFAPVNARHVCFRQWEIGVLKQAAQANPRESSHPAWRPQNWTRLTADTSQEH